jgi:ParB family chromosome partitioning protein
MTILTLPLNKLALSDWNVRKNPGDLKSLKASICAHGGLLQNLQVINAKKKGTYGVVAGGRRLAALQELAAEGKIAADFAVPCQLVEKSEAQAVSLAENTIRQNMTVAEQFRAFSALQANNKTTSEIASTFGLGEQHVKKILRLADVAEELFLLFEQEELELDALKAYAVLDDRAKQLAVFEELGSYASSHAIRRAMLNERVTPKDKRVRFVGLETYENAGGTIEADLFSEDLFLSDIALLERLVAEKLERAAEVVTAEGWAFVEVCDANRWQVQHQYDSVSPSQRVLAEEEQEILTSLEETAQQAEKVWEENDEDDDNYAAYEAAGEALEQFQQTLLHYTDEDKARSGAVLLLESDGELVILRGLLSPEVAQQEAGDRRAQRRESVVKPRISAKLVQDLSVHKTAAVRYEVMNSPALAYDAMLTSMVIKTFYHVGKAPLTVTFQPVGLTQYSKTVASASAAYEAWAIMKEEWKNRLPESVDDAWQAIRAMTPEEKTLLFSFCVAGLVDCITYEKPGTHRYGVECDELVAAANVDMKQWWKPTKETYLAHVKKAQVVETVEEAHDNKRHSKHLLGLKKEPLLQQAEQLLEGHHWLPPELRGAEEVTEEIRAAA